MLKKVSSLKPRESNLYARAMAQERTLVREMAHRHANTGLPVCTGTARGYYTGTELQGSNRPGADDHRRYPSRAGDWLTYLDGRRERFPGNRQEAAA